MGKGVLIAGIVVVVIIGIFFAFSGGSDSSDVGQGTELEFAGEWINTDLRDVRTGESFRVADFMDEGKPVLLETFAVWCPTCTRQQNEVKDLHDEPGFNDAIVSVSLDTDPNEDEARILSHINDNGFNWYYAVAPVDMTQGMMSQFGVGIISAPSVPMVLICPDGSVKKLKSGVKSPEFLKQEVASTCGV